VCGCSNIIDWLEKHETIDGEDASDHSLTDRKIEETAAESGIEQRYACTFS